MADETPTAPTATQLATKFRNGTHATFFSESERKAVADLLSCPTHECRRCNECLTRDKIRVEHEVELLITENIGLTTFALGRDIPETIEKARAALVKRCFDAIRRAEKAEALVASLRENLRRYGGHDGTCWGLFLDKPKCSCGFSAALLTPSGAPMVGEK